MSEAQPSDQRPSEKSDADTSAEVADTQAPAHLGERGFDLELERMLDEGWTTGMSETAPESRSHDDA